MASPVCRCAILLRQSRTVDRGCQPAPGLPCALFHLRVRRPKQSSGEHAARMRSHVSHSTTLSCPGRSAAPLSGALQSRGPRNSECAACWVPALRSVTACRTASGTRERRMRRHLAPSLRAQRSNPESFRVCSLDCLAALAMTMLMQRCAKASVPHAAYATPSHNCHSL